MHTRLKALAAACAIAMALSGSTALAHEPEELGTPLTRARSGRTSGSSRTSRPRRTRPTPANTHVTSSDIAFWGDLAYVGDYGGFRIFDVSKPKPKLVSDMRCYGPQGDPSVWDRDGDGDADTLALSVDSVLAGSQCGAAPVGKNAGDRPLPERRVGGPADLRRLEPERAGAGRSRLPGLRLAHQHAAARARRQVDARAQLELPARRRPDLRAAGRRAGPQGQPRRRAGHRRAVRRPAQGARAEAELPVVYPGDADGTYKPVSEHGISAPLDDFLGCHDLSSFPKKGIVGAACGEQAQVWNIDRGTGLPDTASPRWALRPAERRLLALGDVQLGRQGGQLHRRVVRRRLPDRDDEDRRPAGRPATVQDGQHVLLRHPQRQPAVGVPQPAAVERQARAGGRRPAHVLLVAPRHPGAGARPLPAGQRVLPRRLVGDRLHRPPRTARDRVRGQAGHEHLVGLHLPAPIGHRRDHPGVLQRRPEPQLRHERRTRLP